MVSLIFPTLCLALLVVGVVGFFKATAALAASRGRVNEALRARGLTAEGDLDVTQLGLTLTRADGARAAIPADLAIGSTSILTAPALFRCVVVNAPLAVADQVACARALAQPVFGAFPPPPILAGLPAFDAEFAIFPAPSAPPAEAPSYRQPGDSLAAWATPEILDRLLQLNFRALHVRGGQVQLAFAPMSVDGMAEAIRLTDDLRAAAAGAPVTARAAWKPTDAGAHVVGRIMGWSMIPIMSFTFLISMGTSNMTYQSNKEQSYFTLGANGIACPDGGIYSAGPGYRAQFREHFCYQTPNSHTPAAAGLYKLWLWGSCLSFAIGICAGAAGIHRSERAAAFRKSADHLAL